LQKGCRVSGKKCRKKSIKWLERLRKKLDLIMSFLLSYHLMHLLIYLKCHFKEKRDKKSSDTDKLITKLKNQLGCSHDFAVKVVRDVEARKMVIDGLSDLINELKTLEG
jgi:hypothetical protein